LFSTLIKSLSFHCHFFGTNMRLISCFPHDFSCGWLLVLLYKYMYAKNARNINLYWLLDIVIYGDCYKNVRFIPIFTPNDLKTMGNNRTPMPKGLDLQHITQHTKLKFICCIPLAHILVPSMATDYHRLPIQFHKYFNRLSN
jgi:hypothetical protein